MLLTISRYGRQALIAALAALGTVLLFALTPLDLALQRLLFDPTTQRWLLSANEPLTRFAFYDAPKLFYVSCWLGFGVAWLVAGRWPTLARRVSGIRIVFVSLLLVPLCVAALKVSTNIPCPRDLTAFGGELPYVGLLAAHPPSPAPGIRGNCFPAAHASGGFALLSLAGLFAAARRRKRVVVIALTIGWSAGLYKMAIGDHFLSHTVVSMWLAWLVVASVAAADAWCVRFAQRVLPGMRWAPKPIP